MATKTIKSYKKRQDKAEKRLEDAEDAINPRAGGILRYNRASDKGVEYIRSRGAYGEARDDLGRLRDKKPKGMSPQEWRRQIAEGRAKVQNALKAKRSIRQSIMTGPTYDRVPPTGPKKPKEFIITTVRDPKRKKAKARKARPEAKRGKR
jgi:hypothetical protein